MKVGLIGLGRMGRAMAERLTGMDCEVTGWDIDPNAVARAEEIGLVAAANPAAVAETAEFVISIVSEDHGVRRLFRDPAGFLSTDVTGKLFIDMTTCQPMTSRELAPEIEAAGARIIDAPVLGSIPHVAAGGLNALVGGREDDLDRARPVLDKMTASIRHMGKLGNGCAMKLAINMGMAAYMQAIGEALALGEKQGLSLDQMLDVMAIAPTATEWLKRKGPVLKGEGGPTSLDIKTMRKDAMSAVATGALTGVPMPVASGALAAFSAAVSSGWGDLDIAELPRFFRTEMLQNFDRVTDDQS